MTPRVIDFPLVHFEARFVVMQTWLEADGCGSSGQPEADSPQGCHQVRGRCQHALQKPAETLSLLLHRGTMAFLFS